MSIVILDGMERENNTSSMFERVLKENLEKTFYFKLRDMNIAPCSCCESCSYTTPGKCVVNDDAHEILKTIAKSDTVILLSPIRFGGYSSCLKKIVDKFMLLILPSYRLKKGYLLHPARYGKKILIGIGVAEDVLKEQEENFEKLVEHNAHNLQYPYKTHILRSSEEIEKAEDEVNSILKVVHEG
ncbi:MAG: flavodoxin family protein [Clostridiaceae bacterium]|nr:flavodoxin family protein [Clostridiaceae bacterium]